MTLVIKLNRTSANYEMTSDSTLGVLKSSQSLLALSTFFTDEHIAIVFHDTNRFSKKDCWYDFRTDTTSSITHRLVTEKS